MASRSIKPADLLPLAAYQERRPQLLARIIELKSLRRVEVGPWVSFVFENRETVLFQIQEMLRIEHIVEPDKIEHEIETYEELLPDAGELSATLFIEIPDDVQRQKALGELGGIEQKVAIRMEGLRISAEDKRPIAPQFARPGRASCVYYLRFAFDPASRKAFLSGADPAWIEITHSRYGHAAQISAETCRSLATDLS